MSWLDRAVLTSVRDVAERMGREVRRSPSSDHCACPACGAERRHSSRHDRRGAVGVARDRPLGWRCHACQASGDAVDFVSFALCGARFRDLDAQSKVRVREWFEGPGYVTPRASRRVEAAAPPPPQRPPLEEIRQLLLGRVAVHEDPQTAAYLAFRGCDPDGTSRLDLAFALGTSALPAWARIGETPWTRSRHRLIVPLSDATGVMRSCIARSVERQPRVKSVAPSGYSRAGLVMANLVARAMLRGKSRPDHVLIREGEIDFLQESLRAPEAAVFGIVSGSWTTALAARIPEHAHVVIATDADDAGDRYAHAIAATLEGRIQFERRREAA
jgi:hypothetical protein